jgi:phage shock protein PspC (stress-responsive transcriptional regulator)
MKKTLSINIGSKVFNIDNDAYELLKKYLDSIKSYFEKIETEEDILMDIETRISEKFSSIKNFSESLNLKDVKNIINEMGSVDDFKEIYEEYSKKEESEFNESTNKNENRKIYRNLDDKVIAGVASGIANYFNIDPVISRLLFLASLLTGFGLIVYIICWIGIPGKRVGMLNSSKRLFRDGDNKILGGVAYGIANYFSIDPAIIRIIFIVSLFLGGFGLITYILLWISIPEAKTVEDKMRAKGYEVTLENIEKYIKGAFKKKDDEKNLLIKIILFPFRLIGPIISGVFSLLIPLLRIIISLILFVISIVLIVLMVLFSLGLFNLINYENFIFGSIEGAYVSGVDLSIIIGELPIYLSISIILFFLVSLLVMIISVSRILLNAKNINPTTFIGLLFVGIILFVFNSVIISQVINEWEDTGQIQEWIDDGVIKIDNWKTYRY